jgi:hypothetical protein
MRTDRTTLENKCAGVTVDALPLLAGFFNDLLPIPALHARNLLKTLEETSFPDLLSSGVCVNQQGGPTYCAAGDAPISTEIIANGKTARVYLSERMVGQPKAAVCYAFRQQRQILMMRAEATRPTEHIVTKRGDTLWSLSERLWGNGYLYPFLARNNDLSFDEPLPVGRTLKVPNLATVLEDSRIVKPRDSRWTVAKRIGAPFRRGLPVDGQPSGSPDLVFPYSRVGEVRK